MNIASTDFELFDLPPRFSLDRDALDARWRELQSQVHPDRFVTEGAGARRVAMQWAVRVNEAYQRLKDPLLRAAYLCELNGSPIEAENNTAMPGAFLVQQMEWREALADATTLAEVSALNDAVTAHRRRGLVDLAQTIDDMHDFDAAAQQVRAIMFIARFELDLDRRLEALGQ